MSGGISALGLKDEDVTKFLASSTHIGATNLDFQMEQYVFKRRSDAEGESSQKPKKQKAVDCRRSTAAQFFVEEETVEQTATADRVVQLLNEAIVPKEEGQKLKNLHIVQELIICKEPKLLDNFLDEVVSFQHDHNAEVRKFVVGFIEEACKTDPQMLPKVIGNLLMMLEDNTVTVQKKVIQTTTQLYKVALRWLCDAKKVDEVMEATWSSMTQLKNKIFSLLDSDNEGLRALTIKFMEGIIIAQTFKDKYSDAKGGEISLDDIPVILKIFRPRKMEDEAKEIFQKVVEFHGASHVSSYNLMACMQALTTIGRKRYEFFPKVLQAFESLHANLPPTLSQSQVSSVRKNLKLQLVTLVKHPAALEFHSRISIMLSDLGATPQQISKCFPSLDLSKKRLVSEEYEGPSKKTKLDDESLGASKEDSSKAEAVEKSIKAKNTAIDITAEDLVPKLSGTNVADLVLVSMLGLPEAMPAHFQSTYTPIAAAGTEPQIRHLARLLATQLTIAGLGKGVDEMKAEADAEKHESDDEDDSVMKQIQTVVGRTTEAKPKKQAIVLMPSGSQVKTNRFSKKLDFQDITKPLGDEERNKLSRDAYSRILNAEKSVAKRGASGLRTKILVTLATQFRGDIGVDLKNHILENPRSRLELAFNWLYQEYSAYRGFDGSSESPVEKYEETVGELLSGVLENDEQSSVLFGRFFLDSPHITEGMAESLKLICTDETVTTQALQIARSMTIRRPPKKLLFLGVISELTLHENQEVRSKAVNCAIELHESGHMSSFIEAFALRSLKFLLKTVPPAEFTTFSQQPVVWTEDLTKISLHLYISLLPINHRLIHDLGTVYVETTADIKRTILRSLEVPVKGMSMSSPELLLFVENCPKGAETLVTRIIHILTDKAPPSAELVARVRDLYHKRVPDVRFLIPIINGLTKREVIAALPELIKLNPTVVKEVFHRLLNSNFSSPLSPAELLVALHNIDPAKCNLKVIIKATSLCFEEKNVYSQVVLAMVMQQLMEQNPLPILLMRTVIQSLANYPHLLGFVTNILQRLIVKQVWKQKRIWEGFIKCCQRTKPQSFQVLLQLPPPQLEEVLQSCPDLRDPLCQHVETFTEHQKAHIPQAVMDVLAAFGPNDGSNKKEEETKMEMDAEPLPPGQDHV